MRRRQYFVNRKALILFLVWVSTIPMANAQSLIQNGDFENILNCPAALGNINDDCANWYGSIQPLDASVLVPSPDWYHTCGSNSGMVPPTLTLGYQEPRSGGGMAAIIAYAEIGETYREVIGIELDTNLIIGRTYTVSFSLVCDATLQNGFAINRLGFKFTTHPIFNSVTEAANNTSHGSISEIVTEINNWQTFHFTFQADSAYTYFHLGCFFEDGQVENQLLQFGNVFFSYYFIDDVRIEEKPLFIDQVEISSFSIYPNPVMNEFSLESPYKHLIEQVTLLDNFGKVVLKAKGNTDTYRVDHLPPGIYLVIVYIQGFQPKVSRLFKQ